MASDVGRDARLVVVAVAVIVAVATLMAVVPVVSDMLDSVRSTGDAAVVDCDEYEDQVMYSEHGTPDAGVELCIQNDRGVSPITGSYAGDAIVAVWVGGLSFILIGIDAESPVVTAAGVIHSGSAMVAEAILFPTTKPAPAVVAAVWILGGLVICGFVAYRSRTSAGESE